MKGIKTMKTKRSAQGVQRLVGRKIYYDFNVHTITAHNVCEQNDRSYVTALGTKDGNWFMFRGIDPFGARGTVKLLDFCKFDINRKRGVITAIVGWKGRTYAGTAVYNPKDNFNPTFGRQLALYRALVDPSAAAVEVEKLGNGDDRGDFEDDTIVDVREPNEADEAISSSHEANNVAVEADEVDKVDEGNNDDGENADCP